MRAGGKDSAFQYLREGLRDGAPMVAATVTVFDAPLFTSCVEVPPLPHLPPRVLLRPCFAPVTPPPPSY